MLSELTRKLLAHPRSVGIGQQETSGHKTKFAKRTAVPKGKQGKGGKHGSRGRDKTEAENEALRIRSGRKRTGASRGRSWRRRVGAAVARPFPGSEADATSNAQGFCFQGTDLSSKYF